MTHQGVREVEDAESRPQEPTLHFPAHIVNITGGNIIAGGNFQGPVQQGTSHSTQTVSTSPNDLQPLADFVREMKAALGGSDIPQEAKQEALAEIAVIEAQLVSPRPKQGIIRETFVEIRRFVQTYGPQIALGTGTGTAATLLAEVAKKLPWLQ
jgi:hypothetical protein